jgi:hypothetical protein
VSNGQGSTTRPAKLIIQGSSPPPATGQIAPNRGGFLLDDRGGYRLDGPTFTYSIVTAGNTSAGVYQNGSLVRTLWSNVPTTASSHTYTWDGNDDSGKLLPAGSYEVRVLTSQAKYTWEGTVGNTSNQLSGGSVYHFEGNITSMAIVGQQAFFATGYNEGLPSCSKFSTANPNDKIGYTCKLYGIVDRVASDGINLYWTIEDETQNNNDLSITGDHYNWRSLSSFVAATRVSDNSDVPLSAGAPAGNNNEYPYAIDIIKNNPNGHGTGIAVQKNGSYLFVSHAWMNQLDVLNKTTGALVRMIPIQEVADLAMDSSDSALWMIDANGGTRHVEKYTINADGTLSLAGLITGLSNPLALGVSPNGTTLLVADGGSSYQLKAYGTSSPYAQQWTLGQQGGYALGPDVANDKFFWHEKTQAGYGTGLNLAERTFIAYQPDGSFWVGDPGNFRQVHFDANRNYLEQIAYVPINYSGGPIGNDPTRVLAQFLEFKIDYSKALAPGNGSWTLVKNWGWNVPFKYYGGRQYILQSPVTLSNGRTYAIFKDQTEKYDHLIFAELTSSGTRVTNIPLQTMWAVDYAWPELKSDGTIRMVFPKGVTAQVGGNTLGSATGQAWVKEDITGFDGQNNPIVGPARQTLLVDPLADNDPDMASHWPTPFTAWPISSSGILGSLESSSDPGYHFGGLDAAGRWVFKTNPMTSTHYFGPFPTDGGFPSAYATAGRIFATGRHYLWQFFGEGWQGGQTNIWYDYYDDGLMVGQFGTACGFICNNPTPATEALPGMGGNGYAGNIALGPDGNTYLYHTVESQHGGIMRWKIENLNSVTEQKIPLTFDGVYVSPLPANTIDLHAGLPYDTTVPDGVNGWHRSPAVDNDALSGSSNPKWHVQTNYGSYSKLAPNDVFLLASLDNGQKGDVMRELTNSSTPLLSDWTLAGKVMFGNTYYLADYPNTGEEGQIGSQGAYIDVLDDAGKVIARMYMKDIGNTNAALIANTATIAQGYWNIFDPSSFVWVAGNPQSYSVMAKNGMVTFTYGNYPAVTVPVFDASANIQKPRTLRLHAWTDANAYAVYRSVIDLIGTTFTPGREKGE